MSKFLVILTAGGGAIVVGILLGSMAIRVPSAGSNSRHPELTTDFSAPPSPLIGARTQPEAPALRPAPFAGSGNPPVAAARSDLASNWKSRVDEILGSEIAEKEKGGQLLELFPNLPQEGQIEVAEHLSSLLPDQAYSGLGQYLTNATTPEPVLDVLFAGLLNRSDTLKLPYLLDIARDGQNPKAGEAKELLGALLDENFGNDWTRWQTKVDQWIADYSETTPTSARALGP